MNCKKKLKLLAEPPKINSHKISMKQKVVFGPEPTLDDIQSVLEYSAISFRQINSSIKPFISLIEEHFFSCVQNRQFSSFAELKSSIVSSLELSTEVNDSELPIGCVQLKEIIEKTDFSQIICNIIDTIDIIPEKLFSSCDPHVASVLVGILLILRDLNGHMGFLSWVAKYIAPKGWHNNPSLSNSYVLASVSGIRKKNFFKDSTPSVIVLDTNYLTHIYSQDAPEILINNAQFEFSGEYFVVNDIENKKKFQYIVGPNSSSICSIFRHPKPYIFSQFLGPVPFPQLLLDSFSEALIANDAFLLRSFLSLNVLKVSDCRPFLGHLVNVFSFKRRMTFFLSTLASVEFSDDRLTVNTLLRSNTYFTTLFRYYGEAYGRHYFEKVIKPITIAVDKAGDLKMRKPDKEQTKQIIDLLLFALDTFLQSKKFIPVQMKHIARILKDVMVAHFPSRRAVFNALCGFFCLRFVSLLFLDPKSVDDSIVLQSDSSKTLIPFAQVLQLLFNLQTVTDRYTFSKKKQKAILVALGEVFNFVMGLPEIDASHIIYPSVDESEYYTSLHAIMTEVVNKKNEVDLVYNQLMENEAGRMTPASYRAAELIVKCFES